jgi:hypothetical protein
MKLTTDILQLAEELLPDTHEGLFSSCVSELSNNFDDADEELNLPIDELQAYNEKLLLAVSK